MPVATPAQYAEMLDAAKAGGYAIPAVAEQVPILVVPHGDHCPPDDLDSFLRPLLAESRARRRRGGQPLLLSQMFDGSSLPLDENLAIAAPLLAQCAAADVILEVEIGAVGGEEDGIRGDASNGRLYSTPEEALARDRRARQRRARPLPPLGNLRK